MFACSKFVSTSSLVKSTSQLLSRPLSTVLLKRPETLTDESPSRLAVSVVGMQEMKELQGVPFTLELHPPEMDRTGFHSQALEEDGLEGVRDQMKTEASVSKLSQ
ncbi:hypothetical protein P7K49_031198 [Saguinus oedipus]|uniref:Uncharacterized protein n=1 Tax=Saguinus oedipus TaxID=9490 RepID=A0ABQ9U568_SAGOE|nr:hypothetical protein P7K49_031198 [Saguinus oedipus]